MYPFDYCSSFGSLSEKLHYVRTNIEVECYSFFRSDFLQIDLIHKILFSRKQNTLSVCLPFPTTKWIRGQFPLEDQRKSTVGEVGCRMLMKLTPALKHGPKGLVTNAILPN